MQTAFVFVVLPCYLIAKCCPAEGLLSGHVPSHSPASNSSSTKREQRKPAAFRFTPMPPFKGYRKQNHVTDSAQPLGLPQLPVASPGSGGDEVRVPSQACAWGLPCDAQGHGLRGLLCTQVACSLLSPGSGTTALPQLPSLSPKYSEVNELRVWLSMSIYLTEKTFWPWLGGKWTFKLPVLLSNWIRAPNWARIWKAQSPAKQS